ncbi:MAG TPA: hypothetical protein VEY12_09965 [Thermoplasmata archaeon]|nr:hypothetical protein [Thermoplasmata archaeon]
MPFRELQQHELTQHPDIYRPAHEAAVEAHRRYRRLVLPLISVWAVGSLLLLFAGFIRGAEVFFILVVLPWVIAIAGYLHARAPLRNFQRRAKTIHVPCTICGTVLPSGDLKAHMKSVHPGIARYVGFVIDFSIGTVALFAGGFLAIVVLETLHLLSDVETLEVALLLFAILAGVTVWLRTFALRHLLKLRTEWKESHPAS